MHTVFAHARTPTRVPEVDVRETTAIRSFTRAADVGVWQCTPSSDPSAGRTWSNKAPLRHRHRGLLAPANHAWNEVHLAVTMPTVTSFVRTSMYTSYCFLSKKPGFFVAAAIVAISSVFLFATAASNT